MSRFPDISAASSRPQTGSQGSGFSGQVEQRDFAASHRMDAGLTIKTREGDIVTLSGSRYSSLNARDYSSSYTTDNNHSSVKSNTRQIQLASGETFTFSVQGDLNEQELSDIQNIVSGVDGIISEMTQGNMDQAVAKALSMKSYDSVSMYEADITVARSYSASVQTGAMAGNLPGSYGDKGGNGLRDLLPLDFATPFMDQVAQLLKDQEAQTLAHARQPLSQLFSHYLDQAGNSTGGGSQSLDSPETAMQASQGVLSLALESAAQMVDQLIQNLVQDAFGHTLDQIA